MLNVFGNPDLELMEAAFSDGLLNWHRKDRSNPYMVGGLPVSPLLAWSWDFGKREGLYMNAVRRAQVSESDRINQETLGKLKAAEDPRQAARWAPFRRAAGGAA